MRKTNIVILLLFACAISFIYLQIKKPLRDLDQMDVTVFRGNIQLLTENVLVPFCDADSSIRDIHEFQNFCIGQKNTKYKWIAGHCYKYCDQLLVICDKKNGMYRMYAKSLAKAPGSTVSASLGKRSNQSSTTFNSGLPEQWNNYVDMKRPTLQRLYINIIEAEKEFLSNPDETAQSEK